MTVVAANQKEVLERVPRLVREHALRAMDAWHLAVVVLTPPSLVEPGEDLGFATRDEAQAVRRRAWAHGSCRSTTDHQRADYVALAGGMEH